MRALLAQKVLSGVTVVPNAGSTKRLRRVACAAGPCSAPDGASSSGWDARHDSDPEGQARNGHASSNTSSSEGISRPNGSSPISRPSPPQQQQPPAVHSPEPPQKRCPFDAPGPFGIGSRIAGRFASAEFKPGHLGSSSTHAAASGAAAGEDASSSAPPPPPDSERVAFTFSEEESFSEAGWPLGEGSVFVPWPVDAAAGALNYEQQLWTISHPAPALGRATHVSANLFAQRDEVFVILFGVGERDVEGIYSLREVTEEGMPQETIVAFESEEDALRYTGLLEATMLSAIEHAPTVCTMRQDELLQFCQEVGYHCRLEPGGSLALPPDANVALTDWERSMRLRQGHFSVLDGEPWQGAGSSAEALDGAAAAAAAAAAAWAGGEADLAGDERVPAWLCSESSRDTGSAGDATLEEMRSWLEGCLLSSTFSAAADAAAAAAAAAAPAATAAPAPSSSSSPSGAPLAPAPAAASSPAPPAGAAVQQPAAASAAAAGAGDGEQPAAASTSNAAAALGAAAAAAAAGKQGNLPEGRTFREVAGSAKVYNSFKEYFTERHGWREGGESDSEEYPPADLPWE